MKTWPVGKRVTFACGLLVLFVLATSGFSLYALKIVGTSLNQVANDSLPRVESLSKIRAAVFEVRGSTLVLALPGAESIKAQEEARATELHKQISEVEAAYTAHIDEAEDRALFERVTTAVSRFSEICDSFRQLANQNKTREASELYASQGHAAFQQLASALKDEFAYNKASALKISDAGLSAEQTATRITWCLMILAVGAGSSLAFFVISNINRALKQAANDIRQSAEQVTDASSEVAQSSQQLAKGASEQAATIEETSASGHEISSMTQRNAENSRTAASLMSQVDGKVSQANKKLDEMVSSMGEISSASERIGKIIKVIDEIAFQTNILALNAAVEAARAGEAGWVFAVGADDLRNLAQRCAQAARDTTALIGDSVQSAQNGQSRLHEVSEVIRQITESAAQVKTLVDEVSLGGQEQARGNEQIARALVQMEQATQQTAATAEESASASQQLKAQADSMKDVVLSLEMLVSGRR